MLEYSSFIIFIIFSIVLSAIIPAASFALGIKKLDDEKASVFECGFSPWADSRQKFEIKFFLVAILFIIFDLEISFLFPWSVFLQSLPNLAYWTMFLFLFILTVGLVFEWQKGGLEWE